MSDPIVIENLCKSYGDNIILNNINLTIESKSIFGLVGLNGVGKTTIIKIINGLLYADSGNIKIFDKNFKDLGSRNKIFYLPEKFSPSSFLKGWEFLSLALSYYSREYDTELSMHYCSLFSFEFDDLYKKVSKYSKGMTQKIGLMAAMMSEAELLILDEPMSGLDPHARSMTKYCIKEYRNKGHTVFFSSHILADMEEICDTAAILHKGTFVFNGPPKDLLRVYGGNMEDAFLNITNSIGSDNLQHV